MNHKSNSILTLVLVTLTLSFSSLALAGKKGTGDLGGSTGGVKREYNEPLTRSGNGLENIGPGQGVDRKERSGDND